MHASATRGDAFARNTHSFASLFPFFRLRAVLLGDLDFFGKESFFFLRAIELATEIIDLRSQISGLCTFGWRPGDGAIRILRFFCALLQRSDLLLTCIQPGLQISVLFLNLRVTAHGFIAPHLRIRSVGAEGFYFLDIQKPKKCREDEENNGKSGHTF